MEKPVWLKNLSFVTATPYPRVYNRVKIEETLSFDMEETLTCNDGKSRGRGQDPGDSSPQRQLHRRDGSRWQRTDQGRVSLNKNGRVL